MTHSSSGATEARRTCYHQGMSDRKIATSTLWQMASQIIMAALSIVTVKLVTAGLSLELAGYYNSAYGYLQIFGILADFGLYAVAVREMSRTENREKVFGTLLSLRFIITLLSLGSAVAIAFVLPAWSGTPLPIGIAIAAFVPFFTLMAGIIRTLFQVEYKMHYVAIAEVTQRIVTVGATAVLVWMGARHSTDATVYHLFLLIGSVGAFVLFLFSFIYGSRFVKVRPHWDKALLKEMLWKASPYGIAFFCTTLYRQFDVTLIAVLRADFATQNAYYGFVQRMMDMAYLLPTFLLNSTLPVLSARDEKGDDTRGLLGKTFLIILLIGSTSLLFSLLWSRPLMELLTNAQYLSTPERPGSDTALRLLSFSMFFNGVIIFSFYSMLTKHAWKSLVATLFAGSVFSLVLNVLLIPSMGFVGASITSVATHALLAVALLPQSLRVLPMRFSMTYLGQWIGYTVLLSAFLWLAAPYLTGSWQTAIGLMIAVPVMAGIALITGLRSSLSNS